MLGFMLATSMTYLDGKLKMGFMRRLPMAYLEPYAHVNKWELPHSILLAIMPLLPGFPLFSEL